MSLPAWLNSPAVYCVLLPVEDADDPERASAWMAKAGRPPVPYEIMPVTDPRFSAAVAVTIRSLESQREAGTLRNRTWLVDQEKGLFRVELRPPEGRGPLGQLRPLGVVEDRLLRVLFIRGGMPPAPEGQ
jgi:hypothetical protein